MTNSYNMSMYPNYYDQQYSNQQFPQYDQQNMQYQQYYGVASNRSKTPSVVGSGLLGLLGGGTVGYLKYMSPISKDGSVSDDFAMKAFDNFAEKGSNKEYFKQIKKLLQKLDNVDSPNDFKKLLKNNKLVCKKTFNGVSFDTVCDTVTKDNVKNKVQSLKNVLESSINNEYNSMKDTITACWDSKTKKFVKPQSLRDNQIFESIKKTKSKIQWQKAGKYGCISGAVLAGAAMLYRIIVNKFNS